MKNLFKSVNRNNTNYLKYDFSEEEIGIPRNIVNSFWIADSDYETCPFVKKAIIKRAKHGIYGYSYTPNKYFDIVSGWVEKHYGYKVNKNNTVLTAGVVNALNLVIRLFTKENDNVVVNNPVYNPFYDVIENNNRKIVYCPLIKEEINDIFFTYKIDFEDLENKLKKAKVYILCNPHNPVGRCYSYEEIEKIVNLCKKYNCILVSDEIHCDLIMDGFKHISVGKFFDTYENIVVCTSPSKTFNIAGLGNSNIFIKNEKMYEEFKKAYSEMDIIHNMFGVLATEEAYQKGSLWVEKQNKHIKNQFNILVDFAKKFNFKICKLEATYLAWLDMSRLGINQDELINGLIKHNVWVNSGTIYDKDAIGFIRINLACSKKQLIRGLSLIEEFVKEKKNL